ncbi:MAG: hypothetical protein GTO51_08845 [Candidatus Latescibacteria bacterium]|nr:hypothetical protein [Candidatus Latescibacterota bacterium]NIM22059.1 hypothetical protein [Candidatus Latescibacterota bacterium]NIM66078.1 hypothetical protein [Candidatus Latescibacterota bacterium]NIO02486.1 hypothetical protein [Candidatus Latescibacterota bacterium]NIO29397.1 hypothetical protein [Candidatus Latescibacterota bacterium]
MMCCPDDHAHASHSGIWQMISEKLREKGIDPDTLCSGDMESFCKKMVCIAPDLKVSVQEMGQSARDQTVMVRIDEESSKALDDWVQTGYVKSRSEAAALFIREGLKVRSSELEELREALQQVENAKERLRDKAREVFGEDKTD